MAKKVSIYEFENKLNRESKSVEENIPKVIKLICEQIRSTSLEDMAKTQRNLNVTYHKNHHPSLPGNAPAPDTGNLRASIHYTVDKEGKSVVGRIGTDIEYGRTLEYGTSRIAPRPWLKPALDKNKNFIEKIIKEVFEK